MTNRRPNGRFPPGVSGNPGGRPHRFRELDAALEHEHGAAKVLPVVEKLRELAMAGDVPAARLYLDRVLGPVKRSDEAEETEDLSRVPMDELVAKAMENPEAREAILRYQRTAGRDDERGISPTGS